MHRMSAKDDPASAQEFELPSEVRQQYYALGHWRAEDLWTSFEAVAAVDPFATAFIAGDQSLRFEELRERATRFGNAVLQRGLCPGDSVVVHGRHCLESVIAIMGCAYAKLVVAPLPHMFSVDQICAVIDAAGVSAVVALGEPAEIERALAAAKLRDVAIVVVADNDPRGGVALTWTQLISSAGAVSVRRDQMDADAPILFGFSSGTTGQPKGVVHSSNTVRFAVEAYCRFQAIDRNDRSLVVTAFGFIGSSVLGSYLTFLVGCCTVLLRSWSAEEALALMECHRVTHFLLMPTHAIDMLDSPMLDRTDCSSVTRGVVAGVNMARREDARRRLCAMPFPMYGMAESPGHVTGSLSDKWEKLRTTEGRTLPGTELLICDDEDRPLPENRQGNILVRGPNRLLRYLGADELNRRSITSEGYFRTGDIGFVDADGYLTFVSRSKDIIRRGGVTITPVEVEDALRKHPRISDVAVIGVPDDRLGERGCACVITRDGGDISLESLTTFLDESGLARYLWPEYVVKCSSFPRTPSLKVQKPELRRRILQEWDSAD